jgi:hypothetical protein
MIELSGPALFRPMIAAAAARKAWKKSRTYSILLICTDGCMNDMDDTIETVVTASDAPLGILIVGVGNTDFRAMQELDADDGPLKTHSGTVALSDIVQFVPFLKFKDDPAS